MMRIIISGGGTGGHVFPAIAIANALKAKVPDAEILFIGALGRMEMERVPAAGYPIEGLTISGLQRRLTIRNLSFPLKVIKSMLKARSIIRKFNPDVVIGVGGYASGPSLMMAGMLGIPTLIQEQNSYPGVTNRILGRWSRKICVAYDGMDQFFSPGKLVFTGNPIRQDITGNPPGRGAACSHFGLDPDRKTLLVIGGSLGAGTINQAVLNYVAGEARDQNLQILWQTGRYYYESMMAAAKQFTSSGQREQGHPATVILMPFIDRMDLAYAAADIILSRAGAIAISELCVIGKPVILVPSPNVAEDHQTRNAKALVSRQAAILLEDRAAVENLGTVLNGLLSDRELQARLAGNIRRMGIASAADQIADVAIGLCRVQNRLAGKKTIYFLGIGGIGMSALARYYAMHGARVSGYDRAPTTLTAQLSAEGMVIHYQEDIDQVPPDPDRVIYTPAIPADHKELIYLRERQAKIVKRAEALGDIARQYKTIAVAGTHGKTTTSTLIAHILKSSGSSFLAFLGGISKNYGTNFLSGLPGSEANMAGTAQNNDVFCVVEADEYDRSFLQLSPYLAIITSADADHLDIYGNHEDLISAFGEFTSRIVEGGSLVMRTGTPVTPVARGSYKRFDYAADSPAGFRAVNARIEAGLYHFDFATPEGILPGFTLGVPGRFNLENAVAALAAGYLLGISPDNMRAALQSYRGVQRRFDLCIHRADLVYIDDYAHHPEELRSCILAVREIFPGRRITGIFQPHLYTRTRDFADGFGESLSLLDELILLEIYPARELPVEGVTSQLILDRVRLENKRISDMGDILTWFSTRKPDILLTLGAGDIDQLVQPLTETLTNAWR